MYLQARSSTKLGGRIRTTTTQQGCVKERDEREGDEEEAQPNMQSLILNAIRILNWTGVDGEEDGGTMTTTRGTKSGLCVKGVRFFGGSWARLETAALLSTLVDSLSLSVSFLSASAPFLDAMARGGPVKRVIKRPLSAQLLKHLPS